MASNPINDFSALRFLKKELEKQDGPAPAPGPANEPRKKTVTHKSKDEILGDQKARETGLQPGMRVTLMDSCDRGVIRRVKKDCVEIELDEGFIVPVDFKGFVVNDLDEDFRLRNSVGSSRTKPEEDERPVSVGKAMEIDLHIEALRVALASLRDRSFRINLNISRELCTPSSSIAEAVSFSSTV